jgi:ABC-type glycerol-3-phosphate transport system permease component
VTTEARAGRQRPARARLMSPFRAGQYALLSIVIVISDLPLVWIVLTSIKPDTEIAAYPPSLLPAHPTLQNFENLFRISSFGVYLVNSLVVSVVATALTVVLGMFAAYAFTRFRFRFLRGLGEVSLFAYMVPPILILVPIAQIITGLRLANNLLALSVLYTATLLPFALWVLRSYFHGITIELEQAAMIDGCTRFGAFMRVVVPQAIPGLISTAVFTFNAAWSEYLFASTLLTSPKSLTLSPGLALLMDQTGVYSWGVLMAASVIVTLPVVILFVIAQKQLVSGLGEGAIKG